MDAKMKENLPQEGTSYAGESLPESNSGCPSNSGGGTNLHHEERGKVDNQAFPLENHTGPKTTNTKDGAMPLQTKLAQQTFHRSMFYNKTRHLSIGDLSDLGRTVSITDKEDPCLENREFTGKTVDWQTVPIPRQHKRRRTSRTPSPTPSEQGIPTSNKYDILNLDIETAETQKTIPQQRQNKPPPIMLYGVQDIAKLSELIKTQLLENEFSIKIVTRTQLRLNCSSIDSYKQLMNIVRENNLIGHTFTRKDTKSCRIVIKNLHPSTPTEAIREAIEQSGNTIRGEIINARYGPEKIPLSTFFVNLEPHPNNCKAKQIQYIFNTRVVIEDPIKRNMVPQCKRCQQYGHTKNNCLRPFRCVKCAENHNTIDCPKKDRNTPAKCALCLGQHPANYRGCRVLLEINNRKNNKIKRRTTRPMQINTTDEQVHDAQGARKENTHSYKQQSLNNEHKAINGRTSITNTKENTYAEALRGQKQENKEESKLEILLTQQAVKLDKLMEQMTTLMSLLTTVIRKITR